MLNRRTLRIKAMQAIFAYWQCKKSDYNLALDKISAIFSPDLNSMEVQDKEQLGLEKKEALQLFEANYQKKEIGPSLVGSSEKVGDAVKEVIDFYHQQVRKDYQFVKKNMVAEAEKINDRYLVLLNLIGEFADVAAKDTKLRAGNIVNNMLIQALKSDSSLENLSLKKGLDWNDQSLEVRQWYKDGIRSDETFTDYLNLPEPSKEDDISVINHLVKTLIFKNDAIMSFMEEGDLNWAENKSIVKSMVVKTLKSFDEKEGTLELSVLSYNWEEDREFFIDLFEKTAFLDDEYQDLVAKNTKNWDIERVATLDKIILHMSISEMLFFPSIPMKVTINEYIEISKNYSTPRSKQFINGILDVIAQELIGRGAIRKSGRGLIDNK